MRHSSPLSLAAGAMLLVGFLSCGGENVELNPDPSTELWSTRVPVDGVDLAADSAAIYLVGNADGQWLGKFDGEGVLLWSWTDPDIRAAAVTVDEFGGVYTAGYSDDVGRLRRFDPDGEPTWSIDPSEYRPRALAPAPGGGVYVVGLDDSPAGIWLARHDPDGMLVWQEHEESVASGPVDAVTGADGELVVTGTDPLVAWWVLARGVEGSPLWIHTLDTPAPANAFPSIAAFSDGSIVASVLANDGPEGVRGMLATLDTDADVAGVAPLMWPPTDIATIGGDIVLSGLIAPVAPSLERRTPGGEPVWSLDPPEDCSKTYRVVSSASAVIGLRGCLGESEVVAVAP